MSPDTHPQHRATTSPSFLFDRPARWFLGLLLALSCGWGYVWLNAANGPAGTASEVTPAVSSTAASLQQFSAGGHILGFGVDQVYVASGNHALQVRFVDAEPVPPQSDSAGGAGQSHSLPVLTAERYPGLWPGVDLTYRAAPGGIAESIWQLAPGADVARVRLRYNRPLTLNPDGSLAIRFDTGVLNESAPVAWQERNGQRQPVAVAFALNGERELGFTLGEHDPGLPVWIDPTLTWNTFLGGVGGDGGDTGVGIAVDGSGNVYPESVFMDRTGRYSPGIRKLCSPRGSGLPVASPKTGFGVPGIPSSALKWGPRCRGAWSLGQCWLGAV